jgi:hypothetical protein
MALELLPGISETGSGRWDLCDVGVADPEPDVKLHVGRC